MWQPPPSLISKVHSLGASPPFSTASMIEFRKGFSSRTTQAYLRGRAAQRTPMSSAARQRERHPLTRQPGTDLSEFLPTNPDVVSAGVVRMLAPDDERRVGGCRFALLLFA